MDKEIHNGRKLFPITQKYLDKGLSVKDLFDSDERPSQIQPVLIDLIQNIVSKRNVVDLLKNYESDRFSNSSPISQKELLSLALEFYRHLPTSYSDIDLSPVAPLGTNSILTGVSQKSVLSTIRNVEALADPTTMLALEITKKQRTKTKGSSLDAFTIDLATSARCIRGQQFSKESGFLPHFQLFAIGSGGIGEQMDLKVIEHARIYLNFLSEMATNKGKYFVKDIEIDLSDINLSEILIRKLKLDRKGVGRHSQDVNFNFFVDNNIDLPTTLQNLDKLTREEAMKYGVENVIDSLKVLNKKIHIISQEFPMVKISFDLSRIAGIGYYNGPCFKITGVNSEGLKFPLADGGYSNWLGRLLSNTRAKYFSSGFGLELFGNLFKS